MQELIYQLQALNVFYHSAHWRSKGVNFYQDHLLFARLYEGIDDEIDNIVELLIGFYDDDSFVAPQLFNEKTQKYIPVGKNDARENLASALEVEAKLLSYIATINSDISVGVYNQIASIADHHARNVYLIKQALK